MSRGITFWIRGWSTWVYRQNPVFLVLFWCQINKHHPAPQQLKEAVTLKDTTREGGLMGSDDRAWLKFLMVIITGITHFDILLSGSRWKFLLIWALQLFSVSGEEILQRNSSDWWSSWWCSFSGILMYLVESAAKLMDFVVGGVYLCFLSAKVVSTMEILARWDRILTTLRGTPTRTALILCGKDSTKCWKHFLDF